MSTNDRGRASYGFDKMAPLFNTANKHTGKLHSGYTIETTFRNLRANVYTCTQDALARIHGAHLHTHPDLDRYDVAAIRSHWFDGCEVRGPRMLTARVKVNRSR